MHWDNDVWIDDENLEEQDSADRIEFTSIGVDIGSFTSHLVVSRLVLRRRGRELYSGYTVVKKEIIYESPVIFTPYLNGNLIIDEGKLSSFIGRAYEEAGLTPDQIDTGAVIATGEAARKENAEAVARLFAGHAGRFVCATAGPHLEARLAAHGCGAVKHSLRHAGNHAHPVILSVDVGGGTSKLAVVRHGRVLETCAVNVGSRLVSWGEDGRVDRVEEAGRRVASHLAIEISTGMRLGAERARLLADKLAEVLLEIVQRKPLSSLARQLLLTSDLSYRGPIDLVVFSGGVAEYIYRHQKETFGDLGPALGRAIWDKSRERNLPIGVPDQFIRATVIGASQYTVQVSGNTVFLSDRRVLPLRDLPVVSLHVSGYPLTRYCVEAELKKAFEAAGIVEGERPSGIAIRFRADPEYAILRELVAGLAAGLPRTLLSRQPVVLMFDADVGGLVGHLLAEELGPGGSAVVAVDHIDVRQLDYVDVGQELPGRKTLPVVVKSLIFR